MSETTLELIRRQLAAQTAENEKLRRRFDAQDKRLEQIEQSQGLHDPSLRQDLRELLTYLKETSRRESGACSES